MDRNLIQIILSDEAKAFIRNQPLKAQRKIMYNIRKVESGIMDKELFKKLEGSFIWELRTLFNGICFRLFAFWDYERGAFVLVTMVWSRKHKKRLHEKLPKQKHCEKNILTIKISSIWLK